MARRLRRLAGAFVAAFIAALAVAPGAADEAADPGTSPARVVPGYAFEFPRDHFAHPGFESEWWYYTGNLFAASGRHFGFELTFFRRARPVDAEPRTAWDLDQVYLAHFAVTDTGGGRFVVDERLNRAGPGIAGADAGARRVWNGNWSVEWRPGDEDRPVQALTAMNRDAALRLVLEPHKPVVVHGRDGVSRKVAGDPRAVSHYLSFTRMAASGTVVVGGEEFAVEGQAWMDHEFFSDYLAEGKVGWDWMSVQLDDGSDLMLFGIRDGQGGYGPDTFGTFVDADGGVHPIDPGGVGFRPGRRWRSEATGAEYPVEWEVVVPDFDLRLDVRPAPRHPGGLHRARHPARVLGGCGALRWRAGGPAGRGHRLPGDDRLRGQARHRRHRRGGARNDPSALIPFPLAARTTPALQSDVGRRSAYGACFCENQICASESFQAEYRAIGR